MANDSISRRHDTMRATTLAVHVKTARRVMCAKIARDFHIGPVGIGNAIDIQGFLILRWRPRIHAGIHRFIVGTGALLKLFTCFCHTGLVKFQRFRLATIEYFGLMRSGLRFLGMHLAFVGFPVLGLFPGLNRGRDLERPHRDQTECKKTGVPVWSYRSHGISPSATC
jgi:hypothetical protein